MTYFLLSLAIFTEVAATLFLKASNGWQLWNYGIASIFLYSLSGIFLAPVLKSMSVGLAYTIWSGAGVALVCAASVYIWDQQFDAYAVLGIVLIVLGTPVITTKSSVVIH